MRPIATALLLATLAPVSCGDSGDNAAASLAAATSALATTTTTQAPTTTTTVPPTTTLAPPTTIETNLVGDDSADVAAELPDIIEEYYEALLAGDATAMAALFTEDGALTGPKESQIRSNLSTPSVIQYMMSMWFAYVDYTDVEHLHVITDANNVVVISRSEGMSGTHQRASKTPFSAIAIDVFELRDGKIAQCDAYFEYGGIVT